MDSQVETLRDEIIRKFCRTVLWIDDEIDLGKGLEHPDADALFRDKFDELTKSNLLCHMMGFPPARADDDGDGFVGNVQDVVTTCKALALQADIVIIDWMLGGQDSSVFAEEIIQSLLKEEKGFRFIVVLSQVELGESDFQKLDDSFVPIRELLLKNNKGQFLLSLKKNEFKDVNLFGVVCRAILESYPDYLHLAALEIASRIKELSPQWLSALPENTDLGVLVERGNTFHENLWLDNLQKCVASNLLEDLSTVVLRGKLNSFTEEAIKPSRNPSIVIPVKEDDVRCALCGLKNCIRDDNPVSLSARDFKKLLKKRQDPDIERLLSGIESFTEFCEVQSVPKCDCLPRPGAVYSGLSSSDTDIAVCISGECDCARSTSLLFILGNCLTDANSVDPKAWYEILDDKKVKGGKTILRFGGQAYLFQSSPSSLISKNKTEVSSLSPLGLLRSDIVNRLATRFMTHIRRVGVNQPYISQGLRGEKGLDE